MVGIALDLDRPRHLMRDEHAGRVAALGSSPSRNSASAPGTMSGGCST